LTEIATSKLLAQINETGRGKEAIRNGKGTSSLVPHFTRFSACGLLYAPYALFSEVTKADLSG
jgi:hypothetical protein